MPIVATSPFERTHSCDFAYFNSEGTLELIKCGERFAQRGRIVQKSFTFQPSFTFDPLGKFPEYHPMNSPTLARLFAFVTAAFSVTGLALAEVNKVEKIGPDVYFHEGDIKGRGHCNNGWIVFEDYVLVIDGNFPSGAQEIIPKIKTITDKPIRFAFDTHHHGDHAYGNQVWVENG